jgi:uncharacterized cupredoxin-like copper-binding protein
MRVDRVLRGALVLVFAAATAGACSSSDDGDDKSDTTAGGVTVPAGDGTPVAVDLGDEKGTDGPMTMDVVPLSVAAGSVTFTAENTGTIEHEMVVLKTDLAGDQLEITDGKVSEDGSLGEIREFEAGETASKTFDLDAGKYVLVCNVKDHYELGMWSEFTVTE